MSQNPSKQKKKIYEVAEIYSHYAVNLLMLKSCVKENQQSNKIFYGRQHMKYL